MMRITIADPEKGKYYKMAVSQQWVERHNDRLISCGLTIGQDGFTRRMFQLAQYKFNHLEITQEEYNHSGCQSSCILRGDKECRWSDARYWAAHYTRDGKEIMDMTKKHFQAFADAIKELRKFNAAYNKHGDATVTVKEVEEMCADIFARDNGRFNRERFYRACGRE